MRGIGVVLAMVVLVGCSQSTEQICKETDQVLRDAGKPGFTDTGYLGCLKLSAKEAAQSLHSLREQLEAKQIKAKPRVEVERVMKASDINQLINEFGIPSSVVYNNSQALQKKTGGNYSIDDVVNISYVRSDLNEKLGNKILMGILSNYIRKTDGSYLITWDKVSTDMFGVVDDQTALFVILYNGNVEASYVDFPKYFWQRWFD